MADAGRILIIPRGDYDANSTYDKLDLVKYKGTSWLAKKNATGVEPVEGEYWQNMFDFSYAFIGNVLTIEDSRFIIWNDVNRVQKNNAVCQLNIFLKINGTITGNGMIKIGKLISSIAPSINYDFMININDGVPNIVANACVSILPSGEVDLYLKYGESVTDGYIAICCSYISSD
jgi:hypothetical protein